VDITRVPGGSSGGSAAAVAAGEASFTLGSDTGGSIRQPAAFCGVVGLKPTYGSVSRYGLIAFASSLDQIGPITRTVADNALVFDVLRGYDPLDSTSINRCYTSSSAEIRLGVENMRIGIPAEFYGEGISDSVRSALEKTIKIYERQGARIVKISTPAVAHALSAYYIISSAEASSNLARFDGVRYGHRAAEYDNVDDLYLKSRSEGFGSEVKRRIMLGTFALSSGYYDAYYKKALQVRSLLVDDFARGFERCDVMLTPVAPTTAYKIGEKSGNPLEMYMGDICTVPINIAGVPSLSFPCGVDADGLPVGAQLIAPHFGEAALYRAAGAGERGVRLS
jgi:aspartyl-tRNA(Asn)/glutamyl-tRNA(Gln) amidotransferase subunit A